MNLTELPQEVQTQLLIDREKLHITMAQNDAYNIVVVNNEGTRYFAARRVCECWSDDKGHYMPFGGGTHWRIVYGAVLWSRRKDPFGGYIYEWTLSRKTFGKSINGTIIPHTVGSKKEALAIAQQIGIFSL